MLVTILDFIGGLRRTCGRHLVFLMISCRTMPFLPMTKPGFFVSMIISPKRGSKFMSVISASLAMSSRVIFSASTSGKSNGWVWSNDDAFADDADDFCDDAALVNEDFGFFGVDGEHGSFVFDAGDFCFFGNVLKNVLANFDFVFVLLGSRHNI